MSSSSTEPFCLDCKMSADAPPNPLQDWLKILMHFSVWQIFFAFIASIHSSPLRPFTHHLLSAVTLTTGLSGSLRYFTEMKLARWSPSETQGHSQTEIAQRTSRVCFLLLVNSPPLLLTGDSTERKENIWFHLCAMCKMQTSSLETQSLMWPPVKLSSPWLQLIHETAAAALTWYLFIFYLKASGDHSWEWIIKLIQQPEFVRNEEGNCVAGRCAGRLQNRHVFRLVRMQLA